MEPWTEGGMLVVTRDTPSHLTDDGGGPWTEGGMIVMTGDTTSHLADDGGEPWANWLADGFF